MKRDILITLIVGIEHSTNHLLSMRKNMATHLNQMSKEEVENFIKSLKNDEKSKEIVMSNWHLSFSELFLYCSENNFYRGLNQNLIHRRNTISKKNRKTFLEIMETVQDVKIWQIVLSSKVVRRASLKRIAMQMDTEITELFNKKKKRK